MPARACATLLVALALGACGEEPEGLPVGEAEPPQSLAGDPFEARPPRAPDDSSDLMALPPLGDTLAVADSLFPGPDSASVAAPAPTPPPEPDLGAAWAAFLDGDDLATTPAARRTAARVLAPPFADAVRALVPRTFRRDGTRREAVARVGFDAAGGIVPQEEAVRDSTVRLLFEVVGGSYRLVEATLSE